MNWTLIDMAYEEVVYYEPEIRGAKWVVVPDALGDVPRLQAEKLGLVVTISGNAALNCFKADVTVEKLQLVADHWNQKS